MPRISHTLLHGHVGIGYQMMINDKPTIKKIQILNYGHLIYNFISLRVNGLAPRTGPSIDQNGCVSVHSSSSIMNMDVVA